MKTEFYCIAIEALLTKYSNQYCYNPVFKDFIFI